ncbi:hypothetical protein BLL37_00060 [Pseudomonas azotoformans]|uniref:Schlafen AlbA-2 domain-containing protein n=1 Tax=Pseudomonas azotoformans TaxID=47878 RepID=A0A1V2JQW8_PSEAZ|nr:ATP-binding protein [Pseudomonas azotoformans]OIN44564.1 hypothetical protein BFL39_25870 [Pseudomonas azotoformans]ONH47783.1 hypothetical protein BLL37_00060 [Pseudomonas azotoformans]SDN99203.1 Putative DNA-binding domain-containing protein [Pseudomonas azotoformans]
MDDDTLIQELLYRGEGPTLDYKVKQYPFSGADEGQKSELLKDILAFSNAWRSEMAYILIGVENDTGNLVELDTDIDDSRLQEFVNSKTNHPLDFSYRSLTYNGVKLGLYSIAVQDRPVFVRKQYGRVAPNTIYVRRGSATAIADPSEIAKMGEAKVEQVVAHAPKIIVRIVSPDSNVSGELVVEYTQFTLLPENRYDDYSIQDGRGVIYRRVAQLVNVNYYREFSSYVQEISGKVPFVLEISNEGDHFADDIQILISFPVAPLFTFKNLEELLERPTKEASYRSFDSRLLLASNKVLKHSIKSSENEISLKFNVGKLQAGEMRRTPRIFMINPPVALTEITGRILSDQLRSPVIFNIPVQVDMTSKVLTMEILKKLT